MTAYTIAQGRTLVLPVEWLAYEGGPAVPVTAVTIEVVPMAGPPAIVGPTSTGVTTPATGHNAYAWAVPADQQPGGYLVIWRATDGQGDQVTATDTVTVIATVPVPGAYATVQDLPDPVPADAAARLVRASRAVDMALLTAVYDPDDPAVQETLRQATVAQVAGELEFNRGRGGFSIGRLSVQPVADRDRPVRIGAVWSQAWAILQLAGLTGHSPRSC